MLKSMTGFGSAESEVSSIGKISVQLRSINHKFLDAVFHLPEGFLPLEEKIRKEIENKLKRGRVTCVVTLSSSSVQRVVINEKLASDYMRALAGLKTKFGLNTEINPDALMRLPGVLSLEGPASVTSSIWPQLRVLVNKALADLVKMRRKEGQALEGFLKSRVDFLIRSTREIQERFKKAVKEKTSQLKTDDEKSSFLKDADISEELERLDFHARSFRQNLAKSTPIGKELDFIAQEMQREANTMGAKSCDVVISGKVVQIKSQVEKIREQVQNIE